MKIPIILGILGILIQAIIAMVVTVTVDYNDGNGITKTDNEEPEDQKAQQLLTSFANYVNDNSEKMTQLIKNVARMVKDVEYLKTSNEQEEKMELETKDVGVGLIDAIEALKTSDQEQEKMIEGNIQKLKTMSTRGKWCGQEKVRYKDYEGVAINHALNYTKITTNDTNMELSGLPLDLSTGTRGMPFPWSMKVSG